MSVDTTHISLDGAYDSKDVYVSLKNKFPDAEIVIRPDKNAVIDDKNHDIRNQHLKEIQEHGRINWQKENKYGRRNVSKLSIQRRKEYLVINYTHVIFLDKK